MKTHSNGSEMLNKSSKNRCDICGATYARAFALRCHLRDQHATDVQNFQLSNETHDDSPQNHDDLIEDLIEENIMTGGPDGAPTSPEFSEVQIATKAITSLNDIEMNKSLY